MDNRFHIRIDPIWGTAEILLNGQAVSDQSQLQVCRAQNFFEWVETLPDLLYSEVNDYYSVTVESLNLHFEVLYISFSSITTCRFLEHILIVPAYSVEKRFVWLSEAVSQAGTVIPKVPCFSIRATSAQKQKASALIHTLPAIYRKYMLESSCEVNIWIISAEDIPSITQIVNNENDLVICESEQHSQTITTKSNILWLPRQKWSEIITQWVDQIAFLPYLIHCQEVLANAKISSFAFTARQQMLTRDEPFVLLTLPKRLETGMSCPITIQEFPPSVLSLSISNPEYAVQKGNNLLGKKPGHISVAVLSDKGSVLQKRDLDIYSVTRVTAIALSSSKGGTVLVGDTISIQATYQPKNAENLSKALWSATPDHIVQNVGDGKFIAVAPGKCTVTLSVENVSQSIPITIVSIASDIQLPPEIGIKMNSKPFRVSGLLLPSGSACKEIRCSVADDRIARWDPSTKSLIPLSEGKTSLEVFAIGPTGNILFSKTTPIIVLPEKNIVTPPAFLTLAVCFAILAILTNGTCFSIVSLLACSVCFAICTIINGFPLWRHRGDRDNKIHLGIAVAGMVICIIFLLNVL